MRREHKAEPHESMKLYVLNFQERHQPMICTSIVEVKRVIAKKYDKKVSEIDVKTNSGFLQGMSEVHRDVSEEWTIDELDGTPKKLKAQQIIHEWKRDPNFQL